MEDIERERWESLRNPKRFPKRIPKDTETQTTSESGNTYYRFILSILIKQSARRPEEELEKSSSQTDRSESHWVLGRAERISDYLFRIRVMILNVFTVRLELDFHSGVLCGSSQHFFARHNTSLFNVAAMNIHQHEY